MNSSLIIPALNEGESLEYVLESIPKEFVSEVILVDGGSTDNTIEIAQSFSATVVQEFNRGYGRACSVGASHANGDILVFMDADGANDPQEIKSLIVPLVADNADLVLGSRLLGENQHIFMPWHQHYGNWFASKLLNLTYGLQISDLSPFRAVDAGKLERLKLKNMTYGWPTEMIAKAALEKWHIVEIPVTSRPRYGGKSKISGTFRGTFLATYHIMKTIFLTAIS